MYDSTTMTILCFRGSWEDFLENRRGHGDGRDKNPNAAPFSPLPRFPACPHFGGYCMAEEVCVNHPELMTDYIITGCKHQRNS